MLTKISHIFDHSPLGRRMAAILLAMLMLLPEPLQALASTVAEPADSVPDESRDMILDGQLLIEDPNLRVADEQGDSILVEVRAPGYSPEYGLRRPSTPTPHAQCGSRPCVPAWGRSTTADTGSSP